MITGKLCFLVFSTSKRISVFVSTRYEFQAYTVNLNYQSTLLNTVEEISMVVIGPFFNIALFCFLVIFSWVIQRLFGTSPNIFSRFIMAFGINVLLDPIWILIVDSALMRSVSRKIFVYLSTVYDGATKALGSISSRCSGIEPALLPRTHSLFEEERRPDTRERRKSSLQKH